MNTDKYLQKHLQHAALQFVFIRAISGQVLIFNFGPSQTETEHPCLADKLNGAWRMPYLIQDQAPL